jgi:hypothetical protein
LRNHPGVDLEAAGLLEELEGEDRVSLELFL